MEKQEELELLGYLQKGTWIPVPNTQKWQLSIDLPKNNHAKVFAGVVAYLRDSMHIERQERQDLRGVINEGFFYGTVALPGVDPDASGMPYHLFFHEKDKNRLETRIAERLGRVHDPLPQVSDDSAAAAISRRDKLYPTDGGCSGHLRGVVYARQSGEHGR